MNMLRFLIRFFYVENSLLYALKNFTALDIWLKTFSFILNFLFIDRIQESVFLS